MFPANLQRLASPAPTYDSWAERIAFWCLLAAIVLVPLIIARTGWFTGNPASLLSDQFELPKVSLLRVLTLASLCAWLWHVAINGGTWRRATSDYLVLALLGWMLVTSVISIAPATAFLGKHLRYEGFLAYLNYAVLYFLAMQLVDRPSRVRKIASAMSWTAVVLSFYGVLQHFSIDPMVWTAGGGDTPFQLTRAFATVGNPDMLGGLLAFALPVCVALALTERDDRWRIARWAGTLVVVACWVVTFTRAAWIGGAVGIAIVGVAAWRHKAPFRTVDKWATGLAVAAGGVLAALSLRNQDEVLNVVNRFASILDFGSGSGAQRVLIWRSALGAIAERPIFGWGLDTFRLVFPQFRSVELTRSLGHLDLVDNAHNYLLQMALGIGLVGVVLLVVFLGYVAWRSARTVFGVERSSAQLLLAGFWAGCAAYLVYLMAGLSVPSTTFWLWIGLGVLAASSAESRQLDASVVLKTAATIVSVLAVVVLVLVGRLLSADYAYLAAKNLPVSDARFVFAERAVRLNPAMDPYRTQLGIAHFDAFRTLAGTGQTEAASAQVSQASSVLIDAIDRSPREYENYNLLAHIYLSAGELLQDAEYLDKGEAIAREGLKIMPGTPVAAVPGGTRAVPQGAICRRRRRCWRPPWTETRSTPRRGVCSPRSTGSSGAPPSRPKRSSAARRRFGRRASFVWYSGRRCKPDPPKVEESPEGERLACPAR